MGEGRSNETILTRSCYMNKIRLETAQCPHDEGDEAEEGDIEAEVFLEIEGKQAAVQFERPELIFDQEARLAVAGADAEEWQVAAAGKLFKLAAGVSDSIDFMEGIREIGNTHQGKAIPMPRIGAMSVRLIVASCSAKQHRIMNNRCLAFDKRPP